MNKRAPNLSPEGATYLSPGQRPGLRGDFRKRALKGRTNCPLASIARPGRCRFWHALSGLGVRYGVALLTQAVGLGWVRTPRWGSRWAAFGLLSLSLGFLPSCGKVRAKSNSPAAITVGVTNVTRKSLQRQITLSSEIVPFQEIDVYAKESGFVKNLYVDYGSRVQTGQLMATLEIPELEAQLQVDQSSIKNAMDEVSRAEHQLKRYQAMYTALHLEYTRLNGVFESQPGLVAQQEVDNAQGKDLAAASEVDA